MALVDSRAALRVRLHNITDAVQIQGTARVSPDFPNNRVPVSFTGEILFVGLSKTIELQFSAAPPPGNAAGLSFGRIHIWRIG